MGKMKIPPISLRKNIELDARNWWRIANYTFFGLSIKKRLSKKIVDRIKDKKYNEVKDFIKKEIRKNKTKNEKEFNWLKDEFIPYWENKEEGIIKILNKIHKNKFPVKFIKIHYVTVELNYYGKEKEGFYITINGKSKNKELLCSIIIHELMHLYFGKYYRELCLKENLTINQTEDIKEAFSVLINEEFKDLKLKDRGYDSHKKLREFISKEWEKSKNFEKVLKSTIKYYQQKCQ